MKGEREREYGSERNPLTVAKIRRIEKKCERKVAAVVCEVRGRRRESARPLTPVSGVAASAIRSKRNGENPIEGSCNRMDEEVLGGREGRARGCEQREEYESASRRKKEKNWKTCARREKRRLRNIETAAICAHSQEKCGEREDK